MKKKLTSLILSTSLLCALGTSATQITNASTTNDIDIPSGLTTTQNPMLREATGWHLTNIKYRVVKNGKGVYMGTVTLTTTTAISVAPNVPYLGTVTIGQSVSSTKRFKTYKQNATIYLSGTKTENGSGRSLGAFSTTRKVTYTDYKAI